MPLHPLIVHIPLVLAGLVPFVAGFLAWQTGRGRGSRWAWAVALALEAAIVIGVLIAIDSGGDEAGVVRSVVPRDAIHEHADAAHWFEYATFATLALLIAATFLRDKLSAILGWIATAVALVTVAIGIRVGHLGGKVVFEYDAPAAYKTPAAH